MASFGIKDIEDQLKRLKTVGEHLSIASHTHIHRHLDELFLAGTQGVNSSVADATQDYVLRNPAGSGNVVEVIQFTMTASVGYNSEKYYNVDWPSGGTDVTPWCLSDHNVTSSFEVKQGDSIADTGTADRQIPGGIVGGAKNNPTPFEIKGADFVVQPGETILFRTVMDSANEDIAFLVLVSEYPEGRSL